jgi:hypothetical protein
MLDAVDMHIHHITIAESRRLTIARGETERRALVRDLVRVSAGRLLTFSLVDDHLHGTARCERCAGRLADSLRRVIKAHRPDLLLEPSWIEPVASRAHLLSLIRDQVLQADRHGLTSASLLDAGCCLQDLVGARVLPGFDVRPLREEAPRFRLRDLFVQVGP